MAELREQVTLARSDAAAARLLAAGADRDVSEVRAELRAHTQGLNALRETQLEQGRAISELRQDVGGLRQEIGGLRQEMHQEIGGLRQEMQDGFAGMTAAMAQITTLLTKGGGPKKDDS